MRPAGILSIFVVGTATLTLTACATPRERVCAIRWAKRNHLHLAYVEGIELKEK